MGRIYGESGGCGKANRWVGGVGVKKKSAAHAIPLAHAARFAARLTDGSLWFKRFLVQKMPSVRRTTLSRGPATKRGGWARCPQNQVRSAR